MGHNYTRRVGGWVGGGEARRYERREAEITNADTTGVPLAARTLTRSTVMLPYYYDRDYLLARIHRVDRRVLCFVCVGLLTPGRPSLLGLLRVAQAGGGGSSGQRGEWAHALLARVSLKSLNAVSSISMDLRRRRSR